MRRYGIAVGAVALMTVLRWLLSPGLGDTVVFLLSACAVLVASRYGGRGPGILAATLSLVAVKLLFIEPRYSLVFASPAKAFGAALFALLSLAILLMMSRLRDSLRALSHSENRLRQFVENTPAPIAMLDRNMCYLAVSRRWITDYRLENTELIGRSHYDVFPEIPESWKMIHQECLAGKVITREVDPFPRADGSTDWLRREIHPWRDGRGGIAGIIIFSEVITARLRLEEAARRTEIQYRDLFENMAEGLAYCRMIYRDGKAWDYEHIAVNAAYTALTGLKDVVGKLATELVPGIRESNAALIELFGRVASTGTPEQVESYVAPMDLWFSTSIYCPEPGYFVAVFSTINERKKAEADLQRLNAELELRVRERTAQLEAFSYSVSHDLRAPLRGIDGWSQALLEDYGGSLDEQARSYLLRVRGEAQRMGELIDDLLKLSRVTRSDLKPERVDLSALAQAIADRQAEAHPARELVFQIEPGLEVQGDARLLEIALNNLFDNAVKYTAGRRPARIQFSRCEHGGQPAFRVRDNGTGFDMAHAGALFTAFHRLHKPSEFPGTGIGLAIVQRIVQRHAGRVWAEAEPGRGASFYFQLGGGQ